MVIFLFLSESCWRVLSQIGTEKGGPCVQNRGSVRQLSQIVHYVNGLKFGIGQKWSILQDGPFVRRSYTGFPLCIH